MNLLMFLSNDNEAEAPASNGNRIAALSQRYLAWLSEAVASIANFPLFRRFHPLLSPRN